MRSVPPRGSGWVCRLSIADFRLAFSHRANRQSAIKKPTRYRVVVLTSSRPQCQWAQRRPSNFVSLLVNKKARTAATTLGLTILLTMLWIYLPMLLATPTDVVALNFFFDTLLFCGAILLLANSIDKEPAVARI